MPYIGNTPAEKYAAFDVQYFTTSATTSYTLDHAVANELDIRLVINNVIQEPGSGKAYTASGTTLTLSSATAGTDTMYAVYTGKASQTVNPPAGSVGPSQIANNAVDLTSKVTGTLPIANGGTGSTATTFVNATTNITGVVPAANLGTGTASSSTVLYGDGTFKAEPGGSLVKVGDVQSNSVAGSHDLTGIFSDTYDKYFFSLSTYPITAGQYIYMQFLDSSNNPLTSGYYGSVYGYDQSGNIVKYNDNGTSAAKLNESTSNGRAWQGQGYIVGPTSGITSNKGISWQSIFYDGSNVTTTQTGAYANVLGTDATGMRIYSGVNLAAISLQVYGVVDTKNYNG